VKIKLDIDATPKELRDFFGLPDVQPLQDEMLATLRERMLQGAAGFDPATLLKPFLPEHLQSVEAWQKSLWEAFGRSATGASAGHKEKPDHKPTGKT
jgi:Family of unknown function (DUF6489)